jgi:LysR family transcriptional regulator, benzoate and cis,cis-muconate-responsive activator of ben and cat genes
VELKQLRYFCAVAEVEHFGKAAATLKIAQPALSRQVRQLEDELGVDLFERLPRGVRLTPSGRALLTDGRRLLTEMDDIANRARAAGHGEVGTLRVGVAESASSRGHMVGALIEFRSAYPRVVLELQHMTSLNQMNALTNRHIDAAFVYHFPDDRPDLSHVLVEYTWIVLALPDHHRLAREPRIRLADLDGEPMVWIKRAQAPATHDLTMRACVSAGLSPNIVQDATSESMSLSLVSVGGLLTFVTDTNVERKPGNVVLRQVEDLSLEFSLHLAWRTADTSPLLRRFIEVVERTIAGVPRR